MWTRSDFSTWTEVSIRYRDLDPNGHVNNGSINQFFEDGRVHFREERMGHLGKEILTGFAVVHFDADYHAPLSYPGKVDVGTVVINVGTTSYGLGQGIFQEARCISTAKVISVYFDPVTGTKQALPSDLREALAGASL
jgi:acyl-CoA thioester hydrolase